MFRAQTCSHLLLLPYPPQFRVHRVIRDKTNTVRGQMSGRIEARLRELKIELPEVRKPVANFVACVQTGNLVFVSGQVTAWNGDYLYKGKVGKEISIEDGQKAARV